MNLKVYTVGKWILALCLMVLGADVAYSQPNKVNAAACEPFKQKDAERKFAQIQKAKEEGAKRKMLRELLNEAPDYYEAHYMLGRKTYSAKFFDEALNHFESVISLCPDYAPYAYYYSGKILMSQEKMAGAVAAFDKFLSFEEGVGDKEYEELKELLPRLRREARILSNPVPFNPEPVLAVSTKYDEYSASLSPDNRHIYFTRKMPVERRSLDNAYASGAAMTEVFMRSSRAGKAWDEGSPMPRPFNQADNNGAAAVTANNKHMYFVVCPGNLPENCDIWGSDWQGHRWGPLTRLPFPINSDYWDSHPTISYDGNTLIFSSDRPGGYGKADLYISTRSANGTWSAPKNLGPEINTAENEITPFIHTDSQTLYFSSRGHGSLGGYDIFYSRKKDDGTWKKPQNLGYPINTRNDEISFFVSLDGQTGFMCSNKLNLPDGREVGVGGLDLYSFSLYPEARPEEIVFLEGQLKGGDGMPVGGTVEVKNQRTKEVTTIEADTADGRYVAILSAKDDYVLTVNQEGLAFTSARVGGKDTPAGEPVALVMETEPIRTGVGYRLDNINFATNAFDLNAEAKEIIESFADWLKKNAAVRVAIEGHTDNVGSASANLQLSKNRARAVYEFLILLGIDSGRLRHEGYGSNKPVADNQTEKGRLLNRRTEFVIIGK
jgi:outer membrane protein OmpA-like peptidoglycan-associated protein